MKSLIGIGAASIARDRIAITEAAVRPATTIQGASRPIPNISTENGATAMRSRVPLRPQSSGANFEEVAMAEITRLSGNKVLDQLRRPDASKPVLTNVHEKTERLNAEVHQLRAARRRLAFGNPKWLDER